MWPARGNSPATALSPSMRLTFGRLNRARWRSVFEQRCEGFWRKHKDARFQMSGVRIASVEGRGSSDRKNGCQVSEFRFQPNEGFRYLKPETRNLTFASYRKD